MKEDNDMNNIFYESLKESMLSDIQSLENSIAELESKKDDWDISYQYIQRIKNALDRLKDEI